MNTSPTVSLGRTGLRASWNAWLGNSLRPPAGPAWLQLVWTALFCSAIAVPFTVLGLTVAHSPSTWGWRVALALYGTSLGIAWTCGFAVHGLFALCRRLLDADRVEAWPKWRRALLFTGVPLLGVAIGWPLGVTLVGYDLARWFSDPSARAAVLSVMSLSLLIAGLFYLHFSTQARRLQAERRTAEAQLRLLQGQIEPHFLFNTLANVVGLIEPDPARARRMLEAFIDYLRSSLVGLREQTHTLGQELALVDAYLRILALRMEDRLRTRIEVPAELREVKLPTLLIQPLAENAIRHGLEPKVEGGEVAVVAAVQGPHLVIEVADTGLGLGAAPARHGPLAGAGCALATLRERLASSYGDAARLLVEDRPEGGVRARLELPWPLPAAH